MVNKEFGCKFAQFVNIIAKKIPITCRVIVFSGFVQVLLLCKEAIKAAICSGQMEKRKVKICTGKASATRRKVLFEQFGSENTKGDGTILLVLYAVGGVGLNLTGCHHGIFMEPQYNPHIELQAADRM